MLNRTNGSFDMACRNIALEIAQTVVDKHHDYGPDNINIFKEQGLVVRIWDKLGRLKHLFWNNAEPNHESVDDTFKDVAGYAIIGLMLQRGCFDYPLDDKGDKN